MTHDDLLDLVRRMVLSDGALPVYKIGNTALCIEAIRQGLCVQDGAQLRLTGNGWFTGKKWWAEGSTNSWRATMRERIDAFAAVLYQGDGKLVRMTRVAQAAEYHPHHEATMVAWRIIGHACVACLEHLSFMEIDGQPDGWVQLNLRGFDPELWNQLLDAEPWGLLPISSTKGVP